MNTDWHKSRYSANGDACVEVREAATGADIRDSQHRQQGHLRFTATEWHAFLHDVQTGEL